MYTAGQAQEQEQVIFFSPPSCHIGAAGCSVAGPCRWQPLVASGVLIWKEQSHASLATQLARAHTWSSSGGAGPAERCSSARAAMSGARRLSGRRHHPRRRCLHHQGAPLLMLGIIMFTRQFTMKTFPDIETKDMTAADPHFAFIAALRRRRRRCCALARCRGRRTRMSSRRRRCTTLDWRRPRQRQRLHARHAHCRSRLDLMTRAWRRFRSAGATHQAACR